MESCNHQNADTNRFCVTCGKKLQRAYCINCGTITLPKHVYCSACGHQLNQTESINRNTKVINSTSNSEDHKVNLNALLAEFELTNRFNNKQEKEKIANKKLTQAEIKAMLKKK